MLLYFCNGFFVHRVKALNFRLKLCSGMSRSLAKVTFSSFRSSVDPLYSNLKILPLENQLFLQRSVFMHSVYYKNLPFVFNDYCKQPNHSYPTRYATSANYVLPLSSTNRGQNSIKFAGPKAWANVPNDLKDIAFRKPFSKKTKEHILKEIYEELPPKSTAFGEKDDHTPLEGLRLIFDLKLEMIFQSDDANETFHGF